MRLNTNNPTCPYCDDEMIEWFRQINGNDTEIVECCSCGKKFEINPIIIYKFDSFRID